MPIEFFFTCEKLPVKKVKDPNNTGLWITDNAKTEHLHNRLQVFGPFVPIPSSELKDLETQIRAKQYCRRILDHKDLSPVPSVPQSTFGGFEFPTS